MTGWLNLSNQQRRATLEEAARTSAINAKAIEKDWWVTLVLKAFKVALSWIFLVLHPKRFRIQSDTREAKTRKVQNNDWKINIR